MTEVSLASWSAVRLNVVPEVVVWQLENTREEGEESAVDGFGEVVAELFNFVEEWVKAVWCAVKRFPVFLVPVELFDAIGDCSVAL